MSQTIKYFEKKRKVYPQRVWGKYRKIKWAVTITALLVYYLAPWIRWDRGPHAPDQAILIDMEKSRLYFFFIEIWPQEVYYLTGILILAAICLFFMTSLFGRMWCGYLCFQTIWTDFYTWVERFVQGDRNARMRLDKQRWNLEKFYKKGLTYIIWMLIGLATGGAWVFYFNDAPTLFEKMIHLDVPNDILIWICALASSTYLMAGIAREQVCKFMCPYARFQSAMFDKDSLIIGYDKKRGEKREKWKKGESFEDRGHCINCMKCVNVCPMGIDIRDGLQMECIACGLCIDACNETMDQVGLPQGLVRYDTERNIQRKAIGEEPKYKLIRPRTIYYSLIVALVGGIMLLGLTNRSVLEVHVLHDRNPIFVKLSDGTIRNGYVVKVLNKTHEDRDYLLNVKGINYKNIRVQAFKDLNPNKLSIFADSVGEFRVFLSANEQEEKRKKIKFTIVDNSNGNTDEHETIFISKK